LFQGREERLGQSHVYIFIFNLVDRADDQRVVEADVLAADCAAFVGAWFVLSMRVCFIEGVRGQSYLPVLGRFVARPSFRCMTFLLWESPRKLDPSYPFDVRSSRGWNAGRIVLIKS
jgi:hypothetical protein